MTNTCYPVNASSGSPAFTAQQSRQGMAAFLYNDSTRPVGSRSGYGPGHQPTTLTVTSTTWTIGPFACIVDPAFTTTQGPYFVAADANNTNTNVQAADATNPRIDILYAQVNDTDIDSSGSRAPTIAYLAGTAAASPVAPATPARSFVLATISVPHSGGGSATIAVNNTFCVAAGGILPCTSSATYPATAIAGDYVDDLTLGYPLRYNGSAWKPIGAGDSLWLNVSGGIGFSNSWITYNAAPQYRLIGNRVYLRGGVQSGTGGTAAFTLPSGFRPTQNLRIACQNGFNVLSGTTQVTLGTAGQVQPESNTYGVNLDAITFLVD